MYTDPIIKVPLFLFLLESTQSPCNFSVQEMKSNIFYALYFTYTVPMVADNITSNGLTANGMYMADHVWKEKEWLLIMCVCCMLGRPCDCKPRSSDQHTHELFHWGPAAIESLRFGGESFEW